MSVAQMHAQEPTVPRNDGAEKLPRLRKDLEVIKSVPFWTGAPSFLIHDPLRNKYVRIGESDLQLLSKWKAIEPAHLADDLSTLFKRNVDVEVITDFAKFLLANSLAFDPNQGAWKQFVDQKNSMQKSAWKKLVSSYLFFRIPLVNPQRFLSALWPHVSFLFTYWMAVALAVLALVSLYLVSRQWSVFTTTFMDFLTLEGLITYGVSLVFIKMIHEFGHAFMAHKYQVRVPTIGVAFIVLMPILYTDTTSAHGLLCRKKKLNIDLAGIYAELALASIAISLWVFLPDGPLRSVAFATATLSWVMSLAVNLNPFMRFDGYYILSDLTGFENLQDRGFAIAKWKLRETLFSLKALPPESLPKSWYFPIVLHAWGTWIYRFFLFLGIALLVYAFFIKIVGIALFIIEIAWFILLPIWRELKHWWEQRSMISKSKRSWLSLFIAGLFLLVLFVPWQNKVLLPAVLSVPGTTALYPAQPAKLVSLSFSNSEKIEAGKILAVLTSPDLEEDQKRSLRKIELLQARLARSQDNSEDHSLRLVLENELEGELIHLQGIEKQIAKLTIQAPISGTIVDDDPSLGTGMWLNPSVRLGAIKPEKGSAIVAYSDEGSLMRLREASKGVFIPQNRQLPKIAVSLDKKAVVSVSALHDEILADIYGGPIAVSPTQDTATGRTILKPHQSQFKMQMKVSEPIPNEFHDQIIQGFVRLEAEPKSYASRIGNRIASVLIREFGL